MKRGREGAGPGEGADWGVAMLARLANRQTLVRPSRIRRARTPGLHPAGAVDITRRIPFVHHREPNTGTRPLFLTGASHSIRDLWLVALEGRPASPLGWPGVLRVAQCCYQRATKWAPPASWSGKVARNECGRWCAEPLHR